MRCVVLGSSPSSPGDNRLHGGNFISTFVLIAQNRMSAAADKRAVLDLQIGLLTEHELTKIATLHSVMAKQLGVRTEVEGELEEVKRDVAPDAVLNDIENDAS